jgi:hypothetical protein
MTVASTIHRNDYVGTGTTGPFPYAFRIYAATDLVVTTRDLLGNQRTLTYLTDYTVAGVGVGVGGTITLTTALAAGVALSVQRVRPLTQTISIRNQGAYNPATVEDALDTLAMVDIQQQDALDRSLKLPISFAPGASNEIAPTLGWVIVGTGTGFTTAVVDRTGVVLPGNGRTDGTLTAYLSNNAAFNVRSYGAVGNGIADDTVAIQAAITAANGQPVIFPAGTYLFSSISNVAGKPLVLLGAGPDSTGAGTVLQPTVAANVTMLIDQAANGNFHHLEGFALVGNGTALGGIKWGTATYRSAFVTMKNVRVVNFTGTNAYGLRLDSVQEFDGENVYLQNNYNNVYRPAVGYCTSTSFHGASSYNGGALNCGVLVDAFTGVAPLGLSFRDKYVFESNANEAMKCSGSWAEIVLDDVYFEGNAVTAGNVLTLAGTAGNPMALTVAKCHFDAKGRVGAKNLNLDYIAGGSRIASNVGLLRTGSVGADITTTANVICHFEDNGFGADAVSIYQALAGTITFEETDAVSLIRTTASQVVRGRSVAGQINPLTEGTLITATDVSLGNSAVVTLTGARLVASPVNAKAGQRFVWTFIQGGAGGFAVTWNAVFKVSWSDTGNTVGKRSSVAFVYDGTNWNQDGAQAPYV